jgi:hypothetical protein
MSRACSTHEGEELGLCIQGLGGKIKGRPLGSPGVCTRILKWILEKQDGAVWGPMGGGGT